MTATLDLKFWGRRRARVLEYHGSASSDLAALALVAAFHGLHVDMGALGAISSARPLEPLKGLIGIADRVGLNARWVDAPINQLRHVHLPSILLWDVDQCVVLERISHSRALVHDPLGDASWISIDDLACHYMGEVLELRPATDFQQPERRERLRLTQLWQHISGVKRAGIQTIVLSLVLEAFALASPYYMQVAVDDVLPALDIDLLTVLALGFALFTLINAAASLLRSFVLLSAGTALGFGIATNVARRLFRLPMSWFEQRQIGDVLSRFHSVTPIQQFLTQGAVSAVVDGCLAIFTLALMFFYSPALTLVALTAFALFALVRIVSFAALKAAEREILVAFGREHSVLIESIRGIVTLRLFNREATRHSLWQSRLTDSMNATFSFARIGIWQTTANTLIFGLETVVSVWLAIRFVIDGGFSVGMVFAYMAYKGQFTQRGSSLIDQSIAFKMLNLHLERLSDIALAQPDRGVGEAIAPTEKLLGKIELHNVSYRYGEGSQLILDGAHLTVDAGEHVVITGKSGVGKSTLVKILLGLVEPDDGEIRIDGQLLAKFGYRSYRERVGAVLQEDHVFAGSLADNIALFDDDPDAELIVSSAEAAGLHDDILAMPLGYDTLVGDMGSALSGGQKQRLLLARALYRRPQILVLDEGTSHLEAALEKKVNESISRLGITRVIVAHRHETIAAGQRIYVLEAGRLRDVTAQFRTTAVTNIATTGGSPDH